MSDANEDRTEQRGYERHEFEPFHSRWAKPRCKVCFGFEDHRLHPAVEPGSCGDPGCPVLHADPANPIHPPTKAN